MLRLPMLAILLVAHIALAANWPQFRGPNASGVAAGEDIPVFFGPHSNVVWSVELPGGHSSPVIWNDRLFLTGFENEQLQSLCLNRSNGAVLWKHSVPPTKIERGAHNSHPATSTPCTDGTNLFVYFGSFGAVAYSVDGKELWRTPLRVPITQHGASSSPVLANGLLILQRDADTDSELLALNQTDGHVAWNVKRTDARRSFSTPLILRDPSRPGRLQVIVPGTLRLASYDVSTGKELWTVRGLPNEMCSSPVAADGLVFVAGWTPGAGVPVLPTFDTLLERGDTNHDGMLTRTEAPNGPARQHFIYIDANRDGLINREEWTAMADIFSKSENALLAVRPDGSGEVTKTHIVWKQTRGLPYVPTPLVYDHRVYLVRNGGLLSCYNATNGEPFFQEERIGSIGDYYASPVAAGGKICVASQSGTVTIFASGTELKVLARNALGEGVLATPAIADRTLYVRTSTRLYAFRDSEKK